MTLSIDSQESSNVGHNSVSSPLTWTFDNAAGNLLIVGVTINTTAATSGPTISAVTYNGVAMTLVPSSSISSSYGTTAYNVVALYRLLNPATGSNTVSVSFAAGTGSPSYLDCIAGAISFSGAGTPGNAHTADDVTGSSGTATVSVTGTTSGSDVVSLVSTGTGVSSATSPTTLSWLLNVSVTDAGDDAAFGQQTTSGGTITPAYVLSGSDVWTISAIEVFAASGSESISGANTIQGWSHSSALVAGHPVSAADTLADFTSTSVIISHHSITASDTYPDFISIGRVASLSAQGNSLLPANICGEWWWTFNPPTIAAILAQAPQINYLSLTVIGSGGGGGTVQDSGYSNVYGSLAAFQADIAAWKASGRAVVGMVGGGGDSTVIATSTDVANFMAAIVPIITSLGVQGIDFDIENGNPSGGAAGTSSDPTQVAACITQLKAHFGSSFIIQISPRPYELRQVGGGNGFWREVIAATGISNIDLIAPQDYALNGNSLAAQQSYMNADMADWIGGLTGMTIPANKIIIGGFDPNEGESIATNVQTYTYYKGVYPTLRGAIFWNDYNDSLLSPPWQFATQMSAAEPSNANIAANATYPDFISIGTIKHTINLSGVDTWPDFTSSGTFTQIAALSGVDIWPDFTAVSALVTGHKIGAANTWQDFVSSGTFTQTAFLNAADTCPISLEPVPLLQGEKLTASVR